MSDVSPDSGRSKRRKSRLGRKEYPVGKPVAPPPGWTPPPHASALPPPPAPVPATPLPETPLADWAPPVPPVAEPAVLPPTLDPTGRPMLLSPKSAPIWTPLPREAEPSPEMTYNLTEPPAPQLPVAYATDPELLTPSAKIGLALVGVLLLVGAGLFVFHDGWRKVSSGEILRDGTEDPAPPAPRVPSAAIVTPPTLNMPEPTIEKKEPTLKEPEPKALPEKAEPQPPELKTPPDRPDKAVTTRPLEPPMPPVNPLRTTPIFESDIFPIFQAKCIACHAGRKKGGVDVRSVDALVGKGEEDGVLVRGSITKSRLWRAIDTGKMPKAGPKLTADEKELIRRWIMAGAKSTPKAPPPALPSE